MPKPQVFDFTKYRTQLINILIEIEAEKDLDWVKFRQILAKYPKDGREIFSKENLVTAYRKLQEEGQSKLLRSPDLLQKIQMKPMRTQSGVTPVTVLTKPFPCPGECIFCPNDIRMPKSYLSDEPGAQRAERNNFDPYLQTYRRMKALYAIGHNVDKIEIIILGGTWSFYPESYQIWFIKRIFEAINDFGEGLDQTENIEKKIQKKIIHPAFGKNFLSKLKSGKDFDQQKWNSDKSLVQIEFAQKATEITEIANSSYNLAVTKAIKASGNKLINSIEASTWEDLEAEHTRNILAKHRCVGLVIETRPDKISPEEVIRIRRLGCTKTQIGFQSLQDEVLELNKRGHDVKATREAVKLLRLAGFKIHGHWMANLYGSNPDKDISDYKTMFKDPDFCPDELKIYPCSLIETADLIEYFEKGLWKPYTHDELLEVVSTAISFTPEYCRLTRVIRDIPSTDILVGNKMTNFRQVAEQDLDKKKIPKKDIRSREIKRNLVTREDLELKFNIYQVSTGSEVFIQFVTRKNLERLGIKANMIAGFLRLSLYDFNIFEFWKELKANLKENEFQEEVNQLIFSEKSFWNFFQEINFKQDFKHPFLEELSGASMIREIHVYGQAVALGNIEQGRAQHLGLGRQLINQAKNISQHLGYKQIAVISAIGTKHYYQKNNFQTKGLYQVMDLLENTELI